MEKKQQKYKAKYHKIFLKLLDNLEEQMTENEFEDFFTSLNHWINVLSHDPYNNSRECKFGILKELGFRTITFHSKNPPKKGTGDMRLIFKVDEDNQITLYFAVGKRINERPRPATDIYSIAEKLLKESDDF